MKYLIVENGIISNIIVADSGFAARVGALPYYDGAAIGSPYSPPPGPPTESQLLGQQITALHLAQIEQGQFATELQLQIMEGKASG